MIIVKGFNDAINLDNLGVPVVDIMSNRITETRFGRIVRRARLLANNRDNVIFDNDSPGIERTKEGLWPFAEQKLDVRLSWSPSNHDPAIIHKKPESLKASEVFEFLS